MIVHAGHGWAKTSRNSLVALAALISGCAHKPEPAATPATESIEEENKAGTVRILPKSGVANAAMQPLADVGLKREKIPLTLKSFKTPYARDVAPTCESIAREVVALDFVLGDDIDVKLADQTWRQKGVDAAGDALVDAIESTSTSVIPLRGVVREISGASRRDRQMAAAIQAGKLRRAFLKGFGLAQGCEPPAAPLPFEDK